MKADTKQPETFFTPFVGENTLAGACMKKMSLFLTTTVKKSVTVTWEGPYAAGMVSVVLPLLFRTSH